MSQILLYRDENEEAHAAGRDAIEELKPGFRDKVGYRNARYFRPNEVEPADTVVIVGSWPEIIKRAIVGASSDIMLYCYPGKRDGKTIKPTLLGSSSKIVKGEKKNILTSVIYLSPADESGQHTCFWATDDCTQVCIGTKTGQHAFGTVVCKSAAGVEIHDKMTSRLWKTALYFGNRALFMELLRTELRAHKRLSDRLNIFSVNVFFVFGFHNLLLS